MFNKPEFNCKLCFEFATARSYSTVWPYHGLLCCENKKDLEQQSSRSIKQTTVLEEENVLLLCGGYSLHIHSTHTLHGYFSLWHLWFVFAILYSVYCIVYTLYLWEDPWAWWLAGPAGQSQGCWSAGWAYRVDQFVPKNTFRMSFVCIIEYQIVKKL